MNNVAIDSKAAVNSHVVLSQPQQPEWQTIKAEHATHLLEVDQNIGLDSAEAEYRQILFGRNELHRIKPRPAWRVLVDQFASIVIALLAIAALVAWLTGSNAEAIAILVVLGINAAVGFATEWQAGRALDALRRQSQTTARVRRDGFETIVDAQELVPGDIIILNAGDRVPADARVLSANRFEVEESVLTGESTTVEKAADPSAHGAPIAEQRSMIFMGTGVATGRAEGLVVNTGKSTQLGQIGSLVQTSTQERSPLEIQLKKLGHQLVWLVLIIAVVVITVGWLRGDGLWLMLEVGISLAVAAVPEGLPAVTTLILAIGVLHMARQRALIRRLPAVETLGSTTVICADKTGTLTENRMSVREYFLSDGRRVDVVKDESTLESDPLLRQAVQIGVLCNEASFRSEATDNTRTIGDPTETALLVIAESLVLDVSAERAANPKVLEHPFHTETKRMTTLHRKHDGQHFAALKGAPGVVLDACSTYRNASGELVPLSEDALQKLRAANEEMADRAMRVLALAIKHFEADVDEEMSDEALESRYTFVGFVGMIDPPRPGVAEAIRRAKRAGIRTVMLTGDQIKTGVAIARELGLGGDDPKALHAHDLVNTDPRQLAYLARTTDVFARVSPEEKLRIVEALQQAGEVVAVTGDGVNDAPALKRSNIGIAMGQRGTEVAKEAADVVLADDNFETIIKAVEGGRTIYANITKFVHMMFSHNLAEVLVIFIAIAVGWPLPLLPLQILWMNLVTDVFPALALAMEPPSKDIMNEPPRNSESPLLSKSFVLLIGWQAVMLAAVALGVYAWSLKAYGPGPHSQTIALFSLVAIQLGHTFNCRSRTDSAFVGLFRNRFLWIALGIVVGLQALALYSSTLGAVLGLERPTLIDFGVIVGAGLLPIVLVEITKLRVRTVRKLGRQIHSGFADLFASN